MGACLVLRKKETEKSPLEPYSMEGAARVRGLLIASAEEDTPLTKILKENVSGLKYYSQKEPIEEDFRILWNTLDELMPKKENTSTSLPLMPNKSWKTWHRRRSSDGGIGLKMEVFYARLWDINPDAVIHSKVLRIRTNFFVDIIHAVPATVSFISDCKRFTCVYGAAGLTAREFGSIGQALMHTFVALPNGETDMVWDITELRLFKAWERAYSRFLRYVVPTMLLKIPKLDIAFGMLGDTVTINQTLSVLREEYSNLDLFNTQDRVSVHGTLILGSSKHPSTLLSRVNSMLSTSSKDNEDDDNETIPTLLSRMNNVMRTSSKKMLNATGRRNDEEEEEEEEDGNNDNNPIDAISGSGKPRPFFFSKLSVNNLFAATEAPLIEMDKESDTTVSRYITGRQPISCISSGHHESMMKSDQNLMLGDISDKCNNCPVNGFDFEASPDWKQHNWTKNNHKHSSNSRKIVPGHNGAGAGAGGGASSSSSSIVVVGGIMLQPLKIDCDDDDDDDEDDDAEEGTTPNF